MKWGVSFKFEGVPKYQGCILACKFMYFSCPDYSEFGKVGYTGNASMER